MLCLVVRRAQEVWAVNHVFAAFPPSNYRLCYGYEAQPKQSASAGVSEVSITLAEVSRAFLELGYPADQTLSKLTRFWKLTTLLLQQLTQLEKKKSPNRNVEKNLAKVALPEAEDKTKNGTTLESMVKLQVGQVLWLTKQEKVKYRNIIQTFSQYIYMQNFWIH